MELGALPLSVAIDGNGIGNHEQEAKWQQQLRHCGIRTYVFLFPLLILLLNTFAKVYNNGSSTFLF